MAFTSSHCSKQLLANDSMRRFDARYFHLDFPLTASASIVSDSLDSMTINCDFRSNRDMVGLIWSSRDEIDHPYFKYLENKDYSGIKFGFIANPPDWFNFSLTIRNPDGNHVYRLYPYRIKNDTLIPNTFRSSYTGDGPGLIYNISDVFPNGLSSVDSGEAIFIVDFDNLYKGYDYSGDKISQTNISEIFLSLIPNQYGLGPRASLKTVGDISYDKKGIVYVSDTDRITYWTILNVNPYCHLKYGDVIQMTMVQPDKVYKTPGGKVVSFINALFGSTSSGVYYTYKVSNIEVELKDFTLEGSTLKIKIDNGPLSSAAFIGGKVLAETLQADTGIGCESYCFIVRNMSTVGDNKDIDRYFYPQDVHNMQMASGYDDTYNITPYRQIENIYNLGYRNFINMYMGMSHYFKATGENENGNFVYNLVVDTDQPLNIPTIAWCNSFFQNMAPYGFKFIFSISFEILNYYMPKEWCQKDYKNEPALSGWSPPSSFIIPTKIECLDYLSNAFKHCLTLLLDSGSSEFYFQIGEPWWWDGSYTNGAPCIYDSFTQSLYTLETGNSVPTPFIQNYKEPVDDNNRNYLTWLGDKLGQSTTYIRDSVKSSFPTAKGTLLFFSPQVMNPASEMLTIINFPESEWVYPNYDFVQIEDYDWIIAGELEKVSQTFEAATVTLGYPLSQVHYFAGFVNSASQSWIWPNINLAVQLAKNANIPNLYVWAFPQVTRDGILYDDSDYGTDLAIMPEVSKNRQISENIYNEIIRPVFLCQIGDDIFLNSGDKNINFNDFTWYAVGNFGKIESFSETVSGADQGWTMTLDCIPLNYVDYTTDSLRNKKVYLYIGLCDDKNNFISDPKPIGIGDILDNDVKIGTGLASIKINVRSKLSNWHRALNSRYTDEYQQSLYPDDRGFKFVNSLNTTKIEWGE